MPSGQAVRLAAFLFWYEVAARRATSRTASESRLMTDTLRIIPLGGMGEIGKNMMLFEYGRNILVVDAGIMFPEHDMLGIDVVIPDFSYLRDKADQVRGDRRSPTATRIISARCPICWAMCCRSIRRSTPRRWPVA